MTTLDVAPPPPPLIGDARYAETESLLGEVVCLFQDKADVAAVRDSGKMILDLHATQQERHQEMLEAIRGLTGQLQRAKQELAERKSTLLDETQKTQLLAEKTRVDENIRRLELVRARACVRTRAPSLSRRRVSLHRARAARNVHRRMRGCSRASPRATGSPRSCRQRSSSSSSRRAWRCRVRST